MGDRAPFDEVGGDGVAGIGKEWGRELVLGALDRLPILTQLRGTTG